MNPCDEYSMPARGAWRDGAMTHSLEAALPVTEKFPLGVPCALLPFAISCTVSLTALPTRISAPSGASAVTCLWLPEMFGVVTRGCLIQALSVIPEAPSTHMSGTLVPSAIVSWL